MTGWRARTRFPGVRVTSTTFLPLLVSTEDRRYGEDHMLEEFAPGLAIAFTYVPPYGEQVVTWADLERLGTTRRAVRRAALENLYTALTRLRLHGQPPALMLSFDGMESSALLVDEFWDDLERSVPGELVVGVPARDVVIITGSESRPGLEKARRAIDRVFFAGDQHLLSGDLLVWRQGTWEPLEPIVPRPGPVPGADQVPSSRTGPGSRPGPRSVRAPAPRPRDRTG